MEFIHLVIRTNEQKRLADFYSLMGFTINMVHYSATIGSLVLEIYPLKKIKLLDWVLQLIILMKH